MLRPMRLEDVPTVHELNVTTFEAAAAARNQPPEARPDPALVHVRYGHLVTTDADGCWVAEEEGEIVGCALALRREDVWGLSLLIVRPDKQSHGIGRELLQRA